MSKEHAERLRECLLDTGILYAPSMREVASAAAAELDRLTAQNAELLAALEIVTGNEEWPFPPLTDSEVRFVQNAIAQATDLPISERKE